MVLTYNQSNASFDLISSYNAERLSNYSGEEDRPDGNGNFIHFLNVDSKWVSNDAASNACIHDCKDKRLMSVNVRVA